jgi:gas vesicle protein
MHPMSRFDRIINRAGETAGETRRRAELAARGDRGPGPLAALAAGILGAAAGAVASFLLDPARGRSRRARLLDQGAATVRRAGRHADHAFRRVRADVGGRIEAARASRSADTRPTDDASLTDRVRSTIFRDATFPKGDLNVNVERGIVVLRGEVPDAATRERLVAEAEAIDGVWSVRDLLHLPGEEAVAVSAS